MPKAIGVVRKKRIVNNKYGYIFIIPFFAVFLFFQAYPILNTFILSISDLEGFRTSFKIVGLSNYINLLQDELFREAFRNTLIIWMMNFIPQLALALFLASVFTSIYLKYKGEEFFKIMFYLPNIITAASITIIFRTFFQYPNGVINQVLSDINILKEPFSFFRNVFATRGVVAYIQFFMWYGHTMIILIAGIKSIGPPLFESAMMDGANGRQIFRRITLPLIKPIILYILVTSLVGGMQMFDIPFLLTNRRGAPDGTINTLAMYIYNQAFTGSKNFYNAAAASVILLVFIGIITFFLFRVFGYGKRSEE